MEKSDWVVFRRVPLTHPPPPGVGKQRYGLNTYGTKWDPHTLVWGVWGVWGPEVWGPEVWSGVGFAYKRRSLHPLGPLFKTGGPGTIAPRAPLASPPGIHR